MSQVNDSKGVVIPTNTLISAIGAAKNKTRDVRDVDPTKSLGDINKFNPDELNNIINRSFIPDRNMDSRNFDLSSASLLGHLFPTHTESVMMTHDAEKLRPLAPEIANAEEIIVSSMMSPNDLQEGNPSYSIGDIEELDEGRRTAIVNYITSYFNDTYQLGKKMTKWIKEAKFRSGAAAVLLLPESTLANAVGHLRKYNPNLDPNRGTEAIADKSDHIFNMDCYRDMMAMSVYSDTPRSLTESSMESLMNEVIPNSVRDIANQFPNVDAKYMGDMTKALEKQIVTFTTELEQGDSIRMSENPEIVRFGKAVREYEKTKLGKKLDKLYKKFPYGTREDDYGDNYEQIEKVLDLSKYTNDKNKNKSTVFTLDIPSEAVIPICTPGNKEEKLGYFIILDRLGQPLDATAYPANHHLDSMAGSISNSYTAMYGNLPTAGGVQNSAYSPGTNMTYMNGKQQMVNTVFNKVLDTFMKKKLQNVGLSDVTFEMYESIASCMFYRFLENKQTTLLFVPEEYLTYIAFDFRNNGCGKSVLEDIKFILSLRVTLQVADMMAQMRNSIARKDVTINLASTDYTEEQVREMVYNAIIEKMKPGFHLNPDNIARDMNMMNTSIKTIHENSQGVNIEVQDTQSQIAQPSTDAQEKLTELLIRGLKVPASAMNATSQEEFMRSVVTTHSLFSKSIMADQGIICADTTKHVKRYIKSSPVIMEAILKLLDGDMTGEITKEDKIKDSDANIEQPKNDKYKLLNKVIESLEVSLPKPHIAPDKAQFEVIREYTDIVGNIVDLVYPPELLPREDDDARSAYDLLRMQIKASATRSMLDTLGVANNIDIKELDEIIIDDYKQLLHTQGVCLNFAQALVKARTQKTTDTSGNDESEDDGGSDDYSSDSGSSDFSY